MPKRAPRTIGSEDSLARRVQYEREKRGWSPAGLAERMTAAGCPMSQSGIWKIENGEPRRRITVDEAVAFAQVFGVTFEDLLIHPDVAATNEAITTLRRMAHMDAEFARLSVAIVDAWADLARVLGAGVVEQLRSGHIRWSDSFAREYFHKGMSADKVRETLVAMIDASYENLEEAYRRVDGQHQ